MRQFILAVLAATTTAACSQGGREKRVLSIDSMSNQPDLTLPDTGIRKDTSVALATRSGPPVSPVEQQVTKPEAPAPKATARARRRPRVIPTPKPAPRDTAVQAYAPGSQTDTVSVSDSVRPDSVHAASRSDSATSPDTASIPSETTALSRDTTVPRDTAASLPPATASPKDTTLAAGVPGPPSDTMSTRQTVASRTAETTSTLAPATSATDSAAEASAQAARSAADLAARTLAVGTQIHAQLDDSITSRRDTVGQSVSAHVMENVIGSNGRTLIPAGAQVRFTITRLRPSRSKSSQGRLGLRVDSIALNGQLETVQAETRPVPRELRGRGVTGEDAAKVGGGAAAGAVIGGVVGKTKGAVIGGVAGAAAGAVVATQTKTRDVVVKAKTPVVFVLTAPLVAP
jgi:hypothetical protein